MHQKGSKVRIYTYEFLTSRIRIHLLYMYKIARCSATFGIVWGLIAIRIGKYIMDIFPHYVCEKFTGLIPSRLHGLKIIRIVRKHSSLIAYHKYKPLCVVNGATFCPKRILLKIFCHEECVHLPYKMRVFGGMVLVIMKL